MLPPLFIVLAARSSTMVRCICLGQSDVKIIVAYSSIAHIAPVVALAPIAGFHETIVVMLIISHGFRSSLIFFSAALLQGRFNSRVLRIRKGLRITSPSLA